MERKENFYVQDGTAQAAEAEEEKGATDLGKFKDVNALLKAYNALQAEFTRRSQRLRALESGTDNSFLEGSKKEDGAIDPPALQTEPVLAEAPSLQGEEAVPVETPLNGEKGLFAETPSGDEGEAEKSAKDAPVYATNKSLESRLYQSVRENEAVRSRIIGEYLASLKSGGAPLMKGGTGSPAVLQKKPADLADAGRMALQFFKNGN